MRHELEPLIPELEEDENPELRDFRRRFWWTLPLTISRDFFGDVWPSTEPVRHGCSELD